MNSQDEVDFVRHAQKGFINDRSRSYWIGGSSNSTQFAVIGLCAYGNTSSGN